jgi:5-methylcytosine-specific restriction endonuclease McrA
MIPDERLNDIYDKTSGRCHLCGKRLSFHNHGCNGRRGAWHVDHSVPRARGGTDHLNNLMPACIPCNCSKRDRSNRTVRARNGFGGPSRPRRQMKHGWRTVVARVVASLSSVLSFLMGAE